MYNHAKRKYLPKEGETPDNVGPSTYYFDSYRTFKQNYVPFLSDTTRPDPTRKCTYGDAYYNVVLPRRIKGGSSLRNRASREVYQIADGPSPTEYDPQIPKKQPVPTPRPPGRGKLYLCTPPRGMLKKIPSIPTKVDENGYYIMECGKVVKNLPDVYDTSLGPAFYCVRGPCAISCSNIYKGCAWSKRRAKRDTMTMNDNPGPGEYTIHSTIGQFNERDEHVREMARLFGFVPRYLEKIEMELQKENKPGPGDYNPNTSAINQKKSLSICRQPFVSGAARWKYASSDTPAPTEYNIQGNLKKRRVSLGCVPFGSCAPRFDRRFTKGPSAAEYNVLHDTIQDRLTKKREYFGTVDVPFNMTAKRKLTFASDDSYFMPSAADYLVEPLEVPIEKAANCNFRSGTRRFPKTTQPYCVSAASYNIAETFNKNRDRKSHNHGNVPFQSGQPKLPKQRTPDKPSAADYSCHKGFSSNKLSFGTALRWDDNYDDYPGPGAYNVNPIYGCAIYKGFTTYNLHLKENVLRKKLRLPPGKTWEAWCKELKKKKMLKCYHKEKEEIDYFSLLFADI